MKISILTLCFFIAFLNFASAAELYNCIDRDGNSIVTDNPQDGMKNCVLKDSESIPSSEEPAKEKKKTFVEKNITIEKRKDDTEERMNKINNCLKCCRDKNRACYNYTAKGRACYAEARNCGDTCKSEGSSPSSWSDCWSKSND
jgi:hypothetical protein